MNLPTIQPVTRWVCPNCPLEDETHDPRPHSRMHVCAGLRGLTTPMVKAGTRCKVEARDREDYVRGEVVTKDANGRPVMSVVTTRDDGQDTVVYAPLVRVRLATH